MINNPWDEMRSAVNVARSINDACDASSDDMAKLLIGRLRHVNSWNVAKLKRELRDFNMHTKEWK